MRTPSVLLTLAAALLVFSCSDDRRPAGGGGGEGEGEGPAEGEGEGEGEGGDADAGGPGEGEGEGGGFDAGDPGEGEGEGGSDRPAICTQRPLDTREQPTIDLEPGCRQRGEPLRIKDVRDSRCPDYEALPDVFPGRAVELEEVVVIGLFERDFAVMDPDGGPYSGLWVFNKDHRDTEALRIGTRLRLTGTVVEFYTLTELGPTGDGWEVLGEGDPPVPLYVADPTRLADGGDLTEPLESLLVEVGAVRVDTTVPDCPLEFGMFVVGGRLRVDDAAPFDYVPVLGDVLRRLVGVVHYSFDHSKLLPRGDFDMEVVPCNGRPEKCEAAECTVEADERETGKVVVTEIQVNPNGDDRFREYVELYNPGPGEIDLTGWSVQDCAANKANLTGTLAARDYLVLGASADRSVNGGVDVDGPLEDVFLPNGGGSVLVFDATEALVDQVRYEAGEPWPDRHSGQALELPEPAADNRDGAAWVAGRREYGDGGQGTPGGPHRN